MRSRLLLHVVILAVFGLLMTTSAALAQTPTPNEINDVARELWCPLCNGVRLDNCDLQACIQMREVISEKLTEGESKGQIKAYFVAQYGDVVLGQPSGEGFNLIAWVFPILAAVIGLGWLAYLVLTWRKRQVAPVSAGPDAPADATQPAADDDYLRRVERDLKQRD
ncbi:MAG: Cytochrome c-type biogenesis protein CcmH precursor [Chloroflexi bacterium ADurb.Bin325]|nr:MAG: Cytochrome c-type biogenesis protein CcmH precursor [Chloroflexi bacterium ADurb.Bin325]